MGDFTCGGQVCGTGDWAGPKPGDPDNNVVISAQPAFGGIDVSWTFPGINPHAVAHVILYRSANIEPETMVQLAKVNGTFYFDRSASLTPMEFFYWMRIVSINGTVGPVIGPASSIARDTISDTIKSLTGKIDAGVLSQSLKTDLAKIEINALGITQEILERAQNDDALGASFNEIQAFSEETRALVQNEVLARTEADAAFVNVANTIYAETEEAKTAIQTLSQVVAKADQALAKQITAAQTELNGNISQVETNMQASIKHVDGKVDEIGALYTVKVNVNGLVGGFGVYNDGREVQAGFDVDTFWIGRTNAQLKKPFIVSGDEVFINGAVINKITFNQMRSDDGSLLFAGGKLQVKYIEVDDLQITNANIKGDLKSDNYVAGKSGWIIKK